MVRSHVRYRQIAQLVDGVHVGIRGDVLDDGETRVEAVSLQTAVDFLDLFRL